MKKLISFSVLFLTFGFGVFCQNIDFESEKSSFSEENPVVEGQTDFLLASINGNKSDVSKIYGRIQFVSSFPDYKVKVVSSFPDLKVKIVDSFPDSAGKWQIVNSFPDYKIQIVDSFPDFTIQYVDSFPGVN